MPFTPRSWSPGRYPFPSWFRRRPPMPSLRTEGGQGTVELALALPLLFALVMGILELGMGFNAYVTLQSAAREGARAGAIYLFDSTVASTPADLITINDQRREAFIRDTVASSMGILKTTAPNFDRNTDVVIGYVHDPSLPNLDTRKGDLVTVQVTYRHDLVSKILSENPILTMTTRAEARIE